MPHEIRLPPSAAALSASMRDIGYSLETAIADLIDNSISAGAEKVDIYCITEEDVPPMVAIIDDGRGMGKDEIIQAMKHGGQSQERDPRDLGKFGLGLKTASFSQCRRLTVLSRKDNQLNAAEWNLDVVDEMDDWIISLLDEGEIQSLPGFERLPAQGTLLLWRSLDRLFEGHEGHERQEVVNKKLAAVRQHLSLVFHRFMEGKVEWSGQLQISVNGHSIVPFDPFCRDHPATQQTPCERIYMEESQVILMQGYILPHHSKLSAQKYNLYNDYSSFFENQGVYVYRNCRLVAWGGWFRLIAKSKSAQLARVRIDFPSTLDHQWTIDIKKSRIQPPRMIRTRLRQVLDKIITPSKRVYKARGQRLLSDNPYRLWERIANHEGIRYSLNYDHPLIQTLTQKLDQVGQSQLKLLLRAVGEDLPVEIISMDWNDNPKDLHISNQAYKSIIERLELLRTGLPEELQSDAKAFRAFVDTTHLFDQCRNIIDDYIKKWES